MTTSIPLKHWIRGALEASGLSSGAAALSPAYIESSLQIAIALTKQIIAAEELSKCGSFRDVESLPPPFPVSCVDWADCITVFLKADDHVREHADSSLQRPSAFFDDSDYIKELLDKITKDTDHEEATSQDSTAQAERQGSDDNISFFNVEGTRIFHENGAAHQVESRREKLQRIYSLGLVFYELFSGGELPPLELLVVASPNGGNLTIKSSSDVKGDEQGSANCHGLFMHDIESSWNMLDDMSLDGAGSLGGILNSDHVDHCDTNKNEHRTSSMHKKRLCDSSRSGQSAPSTNGALLCNVSVDCLDMKGVPKRICDLICNMIDCINADFMGNESYNEMDDVNLDLQLMLDKPSVYLHDLDVHKLSLTGLELDDTVIERNKEFVCLQCAYERSIAGSPELAIITGMSGTGKSTLANQLGHFVIGNGGMFLAGKFDSQEVKPFSAVASAFNNFCDVLTREVESERTIMVRSKLQTALGSDLFYLIQVIPNLSKLLCVNSTDISPNQDDCVDAQQRFQYLFCQFVEVISICSGAPIMLFMDDVQWADPASISIIGHILKTSCSKQDCMRFFFLGACRDDEMESDHLFWKMIASLNGFGFKTARVTLNCMDRDTVTQVVSNILHLPPRLVFSLSDIVYHKTKGNPLFFSKMLHSLNKEGLLRLSLSRHRWEWDEEKIQSRALPDDVAMFLVQSISMLHIDVKMALVVLSCFGASIELEVIEAIETDLNLNLIEPLNTAIAEGLVNKLHGRFSFCHDRIHEAAYSMIDEQERCFHHMNYGRSLMSVLPSTENRSLLFAAVAQLNRGGPSAVQDQETYSQIAHCNLLAGKTAIEMSDFATAFSFFDNGITFLRKKHWQDQYDLSLELFNLAAKCALAIIDLTSLTMICDEVSRNAHNFEDTLNTSFVLMTALTHSRITESVELGFRVLSNLGVDIPSSLSQEDSLNLIIKTQLTLHEISDEDFLSYRVLTDYKKVLAIKFLAKLENSIQQTNASLQPIVTVKIIQLTIEFGISPISAIGFAYYGGMLAELGDIQGGYRYTKLAKALLDRNQCNEIAGEVLFLFAELLSYIEPLQVTNEYRLQGQGTAMAAGDIHWACMNKSMSSWALLWHGPNLSGVREAFISAGNFSREHDHKTSLYYIIAFQQLIASLIGDEDETLSTDLLTRKVIENNNPHQLVVIYFSKMVASLVFNNYDEMKASTETYLKFRMAPWHLIAGHIGHFFFAGLASFRIFRETHDPLWSQRGEQFTQRVKMWKDQGSLWNFESKSFLLEAEQFNSNGNFDRAQVLYENAISSAQQHKFILEEALAYELAANFYLNIDKKLMAFKYFTSAHAAYFKWGALAKVTTLYTYIQGKFGIAVPSSTPIVQGTSSDLPSRISNTDTQKRRQSS